jgi:hypothetical protein
MSVTIALKIISDPFKNYRCKWTAINYTGDRSRPETSQSPSRIWPPFIDFLLTSNINQILMTTFRRGVLYGAPSTITYCNFLLRNVRRTAVH